MIGALFIAPPKETIEEPPQQSLNIVEISQPILNIEDPKVVEKVEEPKPTIEEEKVESNMINKEEPKANVKEESKATTQRTTITSRSGVDRDRLISFINPLGGQSYTITSPFGYRGKEFHTGVDMAISSGTPIKASADGTVIETTLSNKSYGNKIIIKHEGGYVTLYAHLQSFDVTEGQEVKQGDIIAYVGSTGRSTGPHLHFEIRKDDKYLSPFSYFKEFKKEESLETDDSKTDLEESMGE